jgi:osmotically-inducible protein OsmY
VRIALILLLAVWGAGAQIRPPAKPPAAHARTGQTPPAKTDAQLEQAIRARFAQSKISSNNFQVHVQGGVATLEGQTDVVQHKGTATRLARTTGAVQVVNRIQISQAARQRAAANLAQGRRRAQVKRGEPRAGR